MLLACAGKVAVTPDPPGVDAPPSVEPDAPVVADEGHAVTGKVMDYFAAQPTPIAEATVSTEGITPTQTVTGAADSIYMLHVPTGSKLYLTASHALYRPTRNVPTTVEGVDVTADIYAMTIQDVKNKYTALGKTPVVNTAFVTVELRKNNGDPLTGVPLANVKLLDMQDPPQPVANATPYFYAANGDPSTLETTSAAYGTPPRARVAFLDVPPGNYQVSVTYPNGGGQDVTELVPLTTVADGAVLARTGNLGGGGTVTDPKFSTDIYPKLQTAAKGGLGCANCHTTGSVLAYDGEITATYDLIKNTAGVIDLTTPANSLLLVKPLYEQTPPQNHPNATFLDINDPDYKLFLLWITNGAKP